MEHRVIDYQALNALSRRVANLEKKTQKLEAGRTRSASTLIWDDLRITAYWQVPQADIWFESLIGVTFRIRVDDLGGATDLRTTHQHPSVGHAETSWLDVGIESAGTWSVAVHMDPASYKLNGATYHVYWKPRQRLNIPENVRDVTLSLGRAIPMANA